MIYVCTYCCKPVEPMDVAFFGSGMEESQPIDVICNHCYALKESFEQECE